MITAIICAAGKGARAGFSQNKLLREYEGLPVLARTLSAFAQCAQIGEILVTASEEDERAISALLSPYPHAQTVRGGNTRTESVYNALKRARGESVLVHDGARPFVTQKIIADCIDGVASYGSAVCALPATDTTVLCENGRIQEVPARACVYTVQTPQGFRTDELLSAYERAFCDGRQDEFTDESGVYAAYVCPPHIFLGDRSNRKLTFAEDFSPQGRVGFGVDTHAFGAPLNFVTLGGVQIPAKSGLVAHSDGDVLVHALMDALLSAASLRDIGYYFPDTDEKYRGADSVALLREVVSLLRKEGYRASNVSVSILAETPRLSPHIAQMKEIIADALSLPLSAVGIAAGTNEKLGYVGEGKGITVFAYVAITNLK